ncbi:unnamed protein product [Kuraishia capsulata CBS 1993]|uniref:Uncharacterized protein n=1 Tax=Kuraishia capsulata CBS 1993 TaxID=1382522 RepID=W6MP15_9ASCO|nr:uncharacterized protein KUCA_T00004358001 [Kuraishia capsulata CBS 1993]CDK28376.1 unnamed protein product [Kuraishia capsulata CBS 1993]
MVSSDTLTDYEAYRVTLKESLVTAQALLASTTAFHGHLVAGTVDQIAESELKEFPRLQKQLVRENVGIVKQRDLLKGEIQTVYDGLKVKRARFNPIQDPRLQKIDRLVMENNRVLQEHDSALFNFEVLDSLELDDADDESWVKSLDLSKEDTLAKVQRDVEDLIEGDIEIDEATQNEEREIVDRLKQVISKEQLKRFKLAFMNDKVYSRDRATMTSLNSKWLQKVNKLANFLENDLKVIVDEIDQIKAEDYVNDEKVLVGSGNQDEFEDDDEEDEDDELEPEKAADQEEEKDSEQNVSPERDQEVDQEVNQDVEVRPPTDDRESTREITPDIRDSTEEPDTKDDHMAVDDVQEEAEGEISDYEEEVLEE